MPKRIKPTPEEQRVFDIANQGELASLAYIEECVGEINKRMDEIEERQKEIHGILWHITLMKMMRENKLKEQP